MAVYTVQGPSGKTYTIEGPEGATADQLGQHILSQNRDERVAHQQAADREKFNPVNGMGTTQRTVAGVGMGMMNAARGVKQALDAAAVKVEGWIPGGEAITRMMGGKTPKEIQADTNASIEEARQADAPLAATTSGKVGNVIGGAAVVAPTMLIPGANTYTGSALLGGATGFLTTPGDLKERGVAGAFGVGGGLVGKAGADGIAAGANAARNALQTRAAQQAAANAGKDAAVQAAQQAGYVVTPAMTSKPGVVGSIAEGIGGKIKTQQLASVENQEITNKLARQALGMAPDDPINAAALKGIRDNAGQAYDVIRSAGTVQADQPFTNALQQIGQKYQGASNSFPGLTKGNPVQEIVDNLNVKSFQASDAVDAIKLLRETADTAYGSRNNSLGKAAKEAANALEEALDRHAQSSGMAPDVVKAFREARKSIAKTYSVQSALNETTGDVIGSKLANQLAKGRPLEGGLREAAQFAQAFPKAAQAGQTVPKFSVLDAGFGGAGLGTGNVAMAALPLLRPGARSLALSPMVQRSIGNPNYTPNALQRLAPELFDNEIANFLIRSGSVGASVAPSKK